MLSRWLFRALLLLLALGGLAFAYEVLFSFSSLERAAATASTGDVWDQGGYRHWKQAQLSTWLYQPYLAPGSRTEVEVGVYGGIRAAIDEINGSLDGQSFQQRGTGPLWGMTIEEKETSSGMGSDFIRFPLAVPANARPGDVLKLRLEVRHTLAVSELFGFRNQQAVTSQTIPIRVHSPGEAILGRCLSAGRALLAFGLVVLAGWWFWRAGNKDVFLDKHAGKEGFLTPALSVLMFFAVMAWGYAGYRLFAVPLLAALGLPHEYLATGLVVCWLVGPLLLWRLLGRKRRAAPAPSPALPPDDRMPGQADLSG